MDALHAQAAKIMKTHWAIQFRMTMRKVFQLPCLRLACFFQPLVTRAVYEILRLKEFWQKVPAEGEPPPPGRRGIPPSRQKVAEGFGRPRAAQGAIREPPY
jgi:hypothetical protein